MTPVGAGAPEDFRRIDFLGSGGGYDERARSCGSNDVAVLVGSRPEIRREGFGTIIAQVLVLVPGSPPPIGAAAGVDLAGHRQCRVERLEARGPGDRSAPYWCAGCR